MMSNAARNRNNNNRRKRANKQRRIDEQKRVDEQNKIKDDCLRSVNMYLDTIQNQENVSKDTLYLNCIKNLQNKAIGSTNAQKMALQHEQSIFSIVLIFVIIFMLIC